MVIIYSFEVGLSLGEDFEIEGKLSVSGEAPIILSKDCFLF
jgi:hypothetical protein